ncbi:MAG: hypothetical protein L6R41_006639 [Letrouitia leprolyta]|nr:MAG: hypothetical protein L6R41_006639 [Letrouitia leprolyta]
MDLLSGTIATAEMSTTDSHTTSEVMIKALYRPVMPTDVHYKFRSVYLTLDVHDKSLEELRTLENQTNSDRAQLEALFRRITTTRRTMFAHEKRLEWNAVSPHCTNHDWVQRPGLEETLWELRSKVGHMFMDLNWVYMHCMEMRMKLESQG